MGNIAVIGSGFSGLSAACYAAKAGQEVTIFEKNDQIGGRARAFSAEGFMFDMGPSWYWMPDIFDKFFDDFGKSTSNFYELVKLNPSFQIYFKSQPPLVVPSNLDELYLLFESIEKGSANKLSKFLKEGELKYNLAISKLIYKPSLSWFEFASSEVIAGALKTNIFRSMSSYIRTFFKDERLISLMEFPVIFLGAMPDRIPALYSLMNYSAFNMGTWYPMGGMWKIADGMKNLALSLGVQIKTSSPVLKINSDRGIAKSIQTKTGNVAIDAIIGSADYHHIEQNLLQVEERNYDSNYWKSRTMAPSSLLFFVGVNKKIKGLLHHNLFFDTDFTHHAKQIYQNPQWPDDPLFYVSCPSKTDPSVAPEGMENIFILIPLAAGLADKKELHQNYFEKVIARIEKMTGEQFKDNIVYQRSYCIEDFKTDYNAFKGNAYGLANTLKQTAVLKPSIRNKKISNLFYAGQLTVPGPGVPPSIISGKIAASELDKFFKKNKPISEIKS